MGIFGALTTAVTGLRAQSFALENISGNIANSQTTAFKRVDTSFLDLIPDNPPSKQLSGTVAASSRATNTVQGDFQSASIGTFMAINGDGFFVVQKPSGFTDGRPTFDGSDLYTRRGDFQTDKDGFLVNGAGYYLMGIPVDAKTGNLAGSVPQLLKFQNDFLPAQPTTQIQYRANLADYPATQAHDNSVPGSELIDPRTFSANPVAGSPAPAQITGFGAVLSGDANALLTGTQVVPAATTATAIGAFTINGQVVGITNGMSHAQVLAAINSPTAVNGTGGFTRRHRWRCARGHHDHGGRSQWRRGGHGQHAPRDRYRGAGRDQDQYRAGGRDRRRRRHLGAGRWRSDRHELGAGRRCGACRRFSDVDRHRLCDRQSQLDGRQRASGHARRHIRRIGPSGP